MWDLNLGPGWSCTLACSVPSLPPTHGAPCRQLRHWVWKGLILDVPDQLLV